MEIQLLHDSPYNTVLIVDGAPLYEIKTPGWLSGRTEVRKAHRVIPIGDTVPVAVIEWKWMFEKTTVELGGQTRAWDEILTPASPWYSQWYYK